MNNLYIRLVVRFVGFLLLQVLVLNNVQLSGLMSPYYYPLFILLLPLQMPLWISLLLAFGMGYSVGIFTGDAGLHAGASVFMAFIRPTVISILFPTAVEEENQEPSLDRIGVFNFVLYAFSLVLLHHFVFFIVQVWSFTLFFYTLAKIFISAILSTLLMLLSEYLFWRKKG